YSGKLKSDTGSVVRKTDDLSTKIDTAKKKPAELQIVKSTITGKDSLVTAVNTQSQGVNNSSTDPAVAASGVVVATDNIATAPKDNNKLWKEYTDSLTSTLKSEVLTSKKIKSGTYYILVEYEIGVDGQVTTNSVSCSPESSFIEQQVKERMTLTAPQMNPVMANGKPRKVVKKYNFTLTKM
ncbi:MAG: hypothetical protein ABUT20_34155, partial [Bacteroidota bacterium]